MCAEGGMSGCFVKSLGRAGCGLLRIKAEGLESVEIKFTVEEER